MDDTVYFHSHEIKYECIHLVRYMNTGTRGATMYGNVTLNGSLPPKPFTTL